MWGRSESNKFKEKVSVELVESMLGRKQSHLYTGKRIILTQKPRVFELMALKHEKPTAVIGFVAKRLEELYQEYENDLVRRSHQRDDIRNNVSEQIKQRDLYFCLMTQSGLEVNRTLLWQFYDEVRRAKFPNKYRRTQPLTAELDITVEEDISSQNFNATIVRFEQWLSCLAGDQRQPEARRQEALRLLRDLKNLKESSVQLTVRMSSELAAEFEKAFQEGKLNSVISLDATYDGFEIAKPAEDVVALERDARRIWSQISRRESLLRPWRRLRWLFSPNVDGSPLARAISESDSRAYASPSIIRHALALRNDLFMSWILWPILTTLLLLVTLVPFSLVDPEVAIGSGIFAGVLLSVAGGQVCATVLSPIAAGAGGIGMGWSFGFALAAALGRFAHTPTLDLANVRRTFAIAVVGGPLGLTAPQWRESYSPSLIVGMLGAIALSIAVAGYLMAQPKQARYTDVRWQAPGQATGVEHATTPRTVLGGLVGSTTGIGIGLTLGSTYLLQHFGASQVSAFLMAFGLFGGCTFALMVGITQRRKAAGVALLTALFVLISSTIIYSAARIDGIAGLVLLAMGNAIFQALWFTAAHVVGSHFSPRAAVIATTLEGAIGFTAFIAIRLLSSQ
jgi:hypothetical protein